jgi:hypothetical protein
LVVTAVAAEMLLTVAAVVEEELVALDLLLRRAQVEMAV